MSIADKFETLLKNLRTDNDATISARYKAITKRLNTDFYSSSSEIYHSRYVGSYGRVTAIKGVSDIDMIFLLPYSVYEQYNKYQTNGQSALLQSVKNSIAKTYSTSDVGGDGQVVVINFTDMKFEVVPVFINKDKISYTYPNSNDGGKWKVCNPVAEINAINDANIKYNKNVKRLVRMMKAWRNNNNVPISGFLIETLAMQFMNSWEYSDKSYLYYDYMTRDFLKFLSERDKKQQHWIAPGSGQYVYRKGSFEGKALTSYNDAVAAIGYETDKKDYSANQSWKKIYGSAFGG